MKYIFFCFTVLLFLSFSGLAARAECAYDLKGTWKGRVVDKESGASLNVTLVIKKQSGCQVRGTLASSDGGTDTVRGRINKGKVTFNVTMTTEGCPGNLKINATMKANNRMEFKFKISDCDGTIKGTGSLVLRSS